MDIKTSPQQVRMIDYPANMQRKPCTPCVGSLSLHRMIQFSSAWSGTKSQCRSGEPALQISLLLPVPSPLLCLLLLEKEAVQYPAPKCDPVARPAQLRPLLDGMVGYIVLWGAAHAMWARQDDAYAQTSSLFITFHRWHFHRKTGSILHLFSLIR